MSAAPQPDRHIASRYALRNLGEADLAMLGRWLSEPHVVRWWGDPAESLAEIREALVCPATRPMIAELEGEPIAYVQQYDPHKEDGHPYQDQPVGTLGIDMTIGKAEHLGVGHGSAIMRQLADHLFRACAPRLIVDPDPVNARAIRAYEKASFTAFDRRTTIYGPALMMARDRTS